MKITVHRNGIILIGKAREIAEQLKVYNMKYQYIQDWIDGKRR